MYFKGFFILALISTLAISACKKIGNVAAVTTTNKPDTDIYIGGTVVDGPNGYAAYWKNNTLTLFPQSFFAYTVAIQGTDVYLAGSYVAVNGASVACYSKNGNLVKLSDSSLNYQATSIAVQGNDVYVAGFTSSPTLVTPAKAMYWKNGIAVNLTLPVSNGPPFVTTGAITLQGSDVYVAGTVTGVNTSAAYWKNGSLVVLPSINGFGTATGIVVSGTDVYVAGDTSAPYNPNVFFGNAATYWKNGVATQLASNNSHATSIAIQGSDVYIAGSTNNSADNLPQAAYWKNGVVTVLPGGPSNWEAFGIAVDGNDIHIVGNSQYLGALYWKNGKLIQLTPSTSLSSARGIAIAIH